MNIKKLAIVGFLFFSMSVFSLPELQPIEFPIPKEKLVIDNDFPTGAVIIKGEHVNLRIGPGTNYPTYVWGNGSPLYLPNNRAIPYDNAEENRFYRAKLNGQVVWVSKDYAILDLNYKSTSCIPCSAPVLDSYEVAPIPQVKNQFDSNEPNMAYLTKGKKTYHIYNFKDEGKIYKDKVNKDNCFFVVSKYDYRIYVYEVVGNDTLLAAHFPICYGKNPGPKTKTGDMSTPECTMKNPFAISQILDASTWRHDFKDGRGSMLAYGHWFMRLRLNGALAGNRSIGIHGSTNNAESVPGRDSEGCIRLRDADIIALHDKFAKIGTKVIVRSIMMEKYPFEIKAEKKMGSNYQRQTHK